MKSRHQEIREQAQAFHRAHPRVWRLFQRFTLDRISRGFEHYSVNAIFERIRWETDQAPGASEQQFKLNNNYRPFYARGFMLKYPEHDGFFRTRRQTSKNCPATGLDELKPMDFDG